MKAIKTSLAVSVLTMFVGIQSSVSSASVVLLAPTVNGELGTGAYAFVGGDQPDHDFLDTLEFSLTGPGNLAASIENSILPVATPRVLTPELSNNKFLVLSLFDSQGHFIAATGDGGAPLSGIGLLGHVTYTLAISGHAAGSLGGIYDGKIIVTGADTPEVPLPAAFPAFASALLVLGWRRKIVSV